MRNGQHPPVKCWLCGSETTTAQLGGGRQRAACRRCGAMFVWPLLTAAGALAIYGNESKWTAPPGVTFTGTYDSAVRSDAFARTEGYVRAALGGPGRVLDVGCGTGGLMMVFRERGWQCTGADPNVAALRICRERGFEAFEGGIERVPDGADPFDCVLFLNTLGYVAEPLTALRRAHSLLTPGGILVVEDPNTAFHGPVARVLSALGLKMSAMTVEPRPPRRLFAYSPRSYRILFERAGFEVLEMHAAALYGNRSLLRQIAGGVTAAIAAISGGRVQLSPSLVVLGARLEAPR
jgi:SAM-dependent methyltransferase